MCPTTYIKNIGDVEYVTATLPADIKGKAIIGSLTSPILISEDLQPGAKLDYVVAHEIGHRLTLDMIINANNDSPTIFELAPNAPAGLIKYFIRLGLSKDSLRPVHPGTRNLLNEIFDENNRGEYTDEAVALEFIAEVYANYATGTGNIPEPIAKRLRDLTESKNALLLTKSRVAAFSEPSDEFWKGVVTVLAAIGAILIIRDI